MKRLLFGSFLIIAMLGIGCGGAPVIPDNGARSDIPSSGPEPGPLEAELLGRLEHITELLTTPNDDPQAVVFSIGRYLEFHKEDIYDNVQQISERIAAMTDDEQVFYEERYAEYFTDAGLRWAEALNAFRMNHPEECSRVDGLMIYFD